MILGSIVKMLARQVPNYHLVAQAIVRDSLSICSCVNCEYSIKDKNGRITCSRVAGRVDDEGYAIVAMNGTCDKASFRHNTDNEFELSAH